ncbi:MAG: hypothetical protein J6W13_02425 [Salinivirgaceae bacterium]|nr:hypothetical protein [Salinivirgaceae bacterium]
MESEQQEMPKMIVAYIDLLGTKERVKNNPIKKAVEPIESYIKVLDTKIVEEKNHPVKYYEKELQELAKQRSIDSFDYFLPFSDSIFLMSKDCNSFIKQLGSFVMNSFSITTNPADAANIGRYPALFRGGVAYEDARPINLIRIVKNKPSIVEALTGRAVVQAVEFEEEKGVKGPRLFFDKTVYDQLDDDTRDYCRITPEKHDLYEILWPAFNYIKHSEPQHDKLEIDEIRKMLKPSYNLWKVYNNTDCSIHYYNLIELIIASTIQFFDKKCQIRNLAKDEVSKWLKDNDMQDKIDIDKY